MRNAFTPITIRGLETVGTLIRRWTLKPETRPEHVMEGGRICVIDVDVFRNALLQEGLCETAADGAVVDFEIRQGVDKVELIFRRPDRFAMLMPEEEALTRFEAPGSHMLPVPVSYQLINGQNAASNPNAPATYQVALDHETYAAFLDPFMAGYVCSQCA